jgi:hypothetical protein
MIKFDKLISMVIVLSFVGVVLSPLLTIGMQRNPAANEVMLGMIATAGFLIALALAMGVLVSAAKPNKE